MNNKNKSIGVFDSGIGGTTVLKELLRILPNENYIYYGDSGNFPYGYGKTKQDIQNIVKPIVNFLIEKECKLIAIACNTATIASLEFLQENFPEIPIIGIIKSGAKTALKTTFNKKIAVFSTEFSTKSNAYKNIILDFDRDVDVTQIACTEFAEMIETGWENYPNGDDLIEKYLSKVPSDTDTLILGCTHYPIIKNFIAEKFHNKVVDPSEELAFKIKRTLKKNSLLNDSQEKGTTIFYTSGDLVKFKNIAENFLGQTINIYKI